MDRARAEAGGSFAGGGLTRTGGLRASALVTDGNGRAIISAMIEAYAVSQPHRDAILATTCIVTFLGSGLACYLWRWRALPAVTALMVLSPVAVVSAYILLFLSDGAGTVFHLDTLTALVVIGLPPAIVGAALGLGFRRMIR